MHEFPKCKYSATAPAVVVADAEAEAALGDGWFDTPAEAKPAKSAPVLTQSAPPAKGK